MIPRRWPLGEHLPELKEKQIFPTGAEAKTPKTKARGGWLGYSDDDIWAMQPDSTIPRWHWTNIEHGCPIHGKEIYRNRAYYPWIMDSKFPWRWKIRCPVGNEEYPSNDFAGGDMTSGEFPDDGISVITPRDPAQRGCQISMNCAGRERELYDDLLAAGVIADFREPCIIRMAPVPLYNSFEDVHTFGRVMRELLAQVNSK